VTTQFALFEAAKGIPNRHMKNFFCQQNGLDIFNLMISGD